MEALLKDLTGLPVTEHCEHGLSPKWRFEIGLAGKGEKRGKGINFLTVKTLLAAHQVYLSSAAGHVSFSDNYLLLPLPS